MGPKTGAKMGPETVPKWVLRPRQKGTIRFPKMEAQMGPKMGPNMDPKMGPKMDPKWVPKWSDLGVKRDLCSMPFLIVFIINLMLFPGGSSPCSFSFLFTSLSFYFHFLRFFPFTFRSFSFAFGYLS